MPQRFAVTTAVALAGTMVAYAHLGAGQDTRAEPPHLSAQARLAAVRRAKIWTPTDVASMDLKAGPRDPGAFAPNETVTCEYVDKKLNGKSPKFTCALKPDDEVKVKYGSVNGEVYGEVAATRLLWALGFGADRMYPVRVVCRGCPPDPHGDPKGRRAEVVFDPASIERKMHGRTLESHPDSGWEWPELDLIDETAGGAPRAHRDALKLLAVIMQHTDTKPAQQRLACVGEHHEEGPCLHPFMLMNDVGLTFGRANAMNRNSLGSVNFERWSRASVWRDPKHCIGNLAKSLSGTLDDPPISEEGRKFLASLLTQLSDAQLQDLFDLARFPLRAKANGSTRGLTIDEWVSAFKHKRDEVVSRSCPS